MGYAIEDGELVWHNPQYENAHVEIAVRDASDGRFIPALNITATLVTPSGQQLGPFPQEFVWHPMLYHYARNWQLPEDGHYTLRVHIDTPSFMRHDEINGLRYTFRPVRHDCEVCDSEGVTPSTSRTASPTTPSSITPRRLYAVLAVAETVTWALLIIGMILKYVVEVGDWPVRVFGLTHGIVFVSYAVTAGLVGVNQSWKTRQLAAAVATAVVPFATIPFDRWLERRGMLDGEWRREATDDPRDQTRLSAVLRLFLRHPVVLSIGLVVAVFAVVSVLLWLGPPTQWFR